MEFSKTVPLYGTLEIKCSGVSDGDPFTERISMRKYPALKVSQYVASTTVTVCTSSDSCRRKSANTDSKLTGIFPISPQREAS